MDKKREESMLDLVLNLIFLIIIPGGLLYLKFFLAVSIYVLIFSCWLVFYNRKLISSYIHDVKNLHSQIQQLDYYFITDEFKVSDRHKRIELYGGFQKTTILFYFFGVINIFSLAHIGSYFFSESLKITFISYLLFVVIFLYFTGNLLAYVNKYTTLIYCSVPFISAIIFFVCISAPSLIALKLPMYIFFIFYLILSSLLYLVLTLMYPIYLLRNLNTLTVIIGSAITLFITIFGFLMSDYISQVMQSQDMFLNVNNIASDETIPHSIKQFLIQNDEILDIINYFFEKEIKNTLNSYISIMSSGLTLSFVIGGFIVTKRVNKSKKKAREIYRKKIITDNFNYKDLKECSYYGGEEYEHLLLNNKMTRTKIFNEEKNLDIPEVTLMSGIKHFFCNKSKMKKI